MSPLGSRKPSVGSHTAPSTPVGSMSGKRSWASPGRRGAPSGGRTSSPNRAVGAAPRAAPSTRCAASPPRASPASGPSASASASSARYTSTLCIIIWVSGRLDAQLADETGGVERAAARRLGPLDDEHVGAARLGQVPRDARAGDAGTDDDDLGLVLHTTSSRSLPGSRRPRRAGRGTRGQPRSRGAARSAWRRSRRSRSRAR